MSTGNHTAPGSDDVTELLGAADALIAAFSTNDEEAYFSSFAPEATFVFHDSSRTLTSREEYRDLWCSWRRSGFSVLACESSDRLAVVVEGCGVFSHTVRTRASFGSEVKESVERESIIFARDAAGGWIAVHEHLSVAP